MRHSLESTSISLHPTGSASAARSIVWWSCFLIQGSGVVVLRVMWIEEGLHVGDKATARHVAVGHVLWQWGRGWAGQQRVGVQHRLKRGRLRSQHRVRGHAWLGRGIGKGHAYVHWGLSVHVNRPRWGRGFLWGCGGRLGQRLHGWRFTNTVLVCCWCCNGGRGQGAGGIVGCFHGGLGRWFWTWGQAAAFGCFGFIGWGNLLAGGRYGLIKEAQSQKLLTALSLWINFPFTVLCTIMIICVGN